MINEIIRLQEALRLCGDAAGGNRYVIEKYCTANDRYKITTDKDYLRNGTPMGIRVNTVGEITRKALNVPIVIKGNQC